MDNQAVPEITEIKNESGTERQKRRRRLLDMTQISLFTVLMIVSARISLMALPIPFSLQLLTAILSGLLLGPWKGALSQILYLVMGLSGLPVFVSGGGLAYIFKPTFGFLLGFVVSALAAGLFSRLLIVADKTAFRNYVVILTAGAIALLLCYLMGAAYYYLYLTSFASETAEKATFSGVAAMTIIPLIWKDLLLLIPLSELSRRLIAIRKWIA